MADTKWTLTAAAEKKVGKEDEAAEEKKKLYKT